MVDIKEGVLYAPLPPFHDALSDVQGIFCFDHQKWNMLWLVEPDVDHGLECAPIKLVEDINTYFDGATREALKKKPYDFLKYINSLQGELTMLRHARDRVLAVIETRVMDAHETLYGLKRQGNVIFGGFGR